MAKYYLIGNAHIDPVWQWRMPEGLALICSTFRSALDRMKEYPDYKFTSACAFYYEWVGEIDPDMLQEIKERVKEGRWGICGGMWVQPDCNIPSGEAFCRHLLYSQKLFYEYFGKCAETGYNVDSFGHNGNLPQLLSRAGIKNYVYMRPNREAEKNSLPPENLHIWQSPDGSRVKAFRILDGYGDDLREERIARYRDRAQPQMLFYGIGNHGGGPSKAHLEQARRLIEDSDYIYALPDDYFNGADCFMPVVSEDLQHHASGCYSANSSVKKANRRAECEIVRAEKSDVLAHLLVSAPLHAQQITSAWKKIMFNQFHDILAGCSVKEAYTDALNAFGFAAETALEISMASLQKISWRINTAGIYGSALSEMYDRLWCREGEGAPIVLFNPHSFDVKTSVSFGTQCVSRVCSSDGEEAIFQLVRASYTDGSHINKCLFEAEIPAYGYSVYYLFRKEENAVKNHFGTALSAEGAILENPHVKIEFDEDTGGIKSYVLKSENTEFAGGLLCKAVICDDSKNDTWAHAVTDFNIDTDHFKDGELSVIENGPLRATVKSTAYYNKSIITRYYSLYYNSEKLHIRTVIDFNEPYKLCKLSFKTNIDSAKMTYSMPYGFIEKPANGEEEPSHGWCDIRDNSGKGLALVNDSKYSFCAVGNDMRMIAARNCAYLDHFGQSSRDSEMRFIDKGEQEFGLVMIPHTATDNVSFFKESELLNTPVFVQQETHHSGSLPPKYRGVQIEKNNIILTAVKKAEDGNGYILRFLECSGKNTICRADFTAMNVSFEMSFGKHEIKTVRVLPDGAVREAQITEMG